MTIVELNNAIESNKWYISYHNNKIKDYHNGIICHIRDKFFELITKIGNKDLGIRAIEVNNSFKFYAEIEFGFTDKFDFGSRFMIYYMNGEVYLNHGTIGPFKDSDKFQCDRIHVMSYMLNHWDEIKEIFNYRPIEDFVKLHTVVEELEKNMVDLEKQKLEIEVNEFVNDLKIDETICQYKEKTSLYLRVHLSLSGPCKVKRNSRKTIEFETSYGERFRLDKFVVYDLYKRDLILVK